MEIERLRREGSKQLEVKKKYLISNKFLQKFQTLQMQIAVLIA